MPTPPTEPIAAAVEEQSGHHEQIDLLWAELRVRGVRLRDSAITRTESLAGRHAVATDDVRACAHNVLRHRVLLNFRAQSDAVSADDVVNAVLETVTAPHAG